MKIIDAHVHVFDALKGLRGEGDMEAIGNGQIRFANGKIVNMVPKELGDRNFTTDVCYDFLKKQGVEKAVLLQGSFYGFDNAYVAAAQEKYPDFFKACGTFDPFMSCADQIYDRLTNELHMTGMKFELSEGGGIASYHRFFDIYEVMNPIAGKCEKNGQTLVLDLGSPGMCSMQTEAVARLADEHPGLDIVICHLLAPQLGDEEPLKKGLDDLVRPNVYFDIAALPFNVGPETYPFPTGIAYLKLAKDIVGTDKLIWGTDVPSVLCANSYTKLLDYFIKTDIFSGSEVEDILYNNAVKAYKL